jgi:hypothetical protein
MRPPALTARGQAHVGWLFSDPATVTRDYFKRTGFFPIMHVVGVRRALAERHAWLPGAVLKAFEQAKQAALRQLADTGASRVMLPFLEETLRDVRALMGSDPSADLVAFSHLQFSQIRGPPALPICAKYSVRHHDRSTTVGGRDPDIRKTA